MTTQERVIEVLKSTLGAQEYTSESKLTDDLGADSIDMVDITIDLEREFGIDFSDLEGKIRGWVTVGDIVAAMDKALVDAGS